MKLGIIIGIILVVVGICTLIYYYDNDKSKGTFWSGIGEILVGIIEILGEVLTAFL